MKRHLKTTLGLTLGTLLMTACMQAGHADVVHLHNGKVKEGRVDRVTGELIEFKTSMGLDSEMIPRLTLTDRRDMVETRTHKKYFGEITYIDVFKVEIHTVGGGHSKLNRLLVKNIVLGSPLQQPMSDFSESQPPQQQEPTLRPAAMMPEPNPVSNDMSAAPTTQGKPIVSFPKDITPSDAPATSTSTSSMVPASTSELAAPAPGEDQDAIPATDERNP